MNLEQFGRAGIIGINSGPRIAIPNDGREQTEPVKINLRSFIIPGPARVAVAVEPLRLAWWFDAPSDAEIRALLSSGRFGDYLAGLQKTRSLRAELLRRSKYGASAIARYRAVAGPSFASALETGSQLGETVGSLAAAGGPIAQGAAILGGMLGGLVLGIIPFERNAAEEQWRKFTSALKPIDRYAILSQLRSVALENARRERKEFPGAIPGDPLGPWRWADDPPLGHSPWGGPVGRTVNLVEILAENTMVPQETADDNTSEKRFVALYTLLALAGAHDDDKTPEQMRALWPRFENGTISPVHTPYFMKLKTRKLGVLRASASSQGIRGIWNPPVTPGIKKALENG